MTTMQITVRGSAEQRFPAEIALLQLAVAMDGPHRPQVLADAVAVQEPLLAELARLRDAGAVSGFAHDQVRVRSHRPYSPDGGTPPLQHDARLEARAEFVDLDQLTRFVDVWSQREGVEIVHLSWDVTAAHRREFEAAVRTAAVEDAVQKAQSLADAVSAGTVVVQHLADPGLLSPSEVGGPAPLMARMAADSGSGLDLQAGEIVIGMGVDARFSAG